MNSFSGRNQLDICNASDNFEVHRAAPMWLREAGVGARPTLELLTAAAGAAAAHAAVAAAVSGHDAAAEAAGWGVAQVDDAGERVGGVDGTRERSLVAGRWP